MDLDVNIKISYDDLSEDCRRKIENLRKHGYNVHISYPANSLDFEDPVWNTIIGHNTGERGGVLLNNTSDNINEKHDVTLYSVHKPDIVSIGTADTGK